MLESLQDFFPKDAKLQLCQAIAHTAMNAKTKREMLSDIGTFYFCIIVVDGTFIFSSIH